MQDETEKNFYQKQRFDATMLISILHHLSDKDLENILPKIKIFTKKVVIIADIIPDPKGILRKVMVKLDQGKFVRPRQQKIEVLNRYFTVVNTTIIPSRLAVQFGIICEV